MEIKYKSISASYINNWWMEYGVFYTRRNLKDDLRLFGIVCIR